MKTTICLLTIIAAFAFCQRTAAQPDHYVINGLIEGAEGVKFVLQSNTSGKIVTIDSAIVVNGKFSMFKGSAKYPELDYLLAPEKNRGIAFFVENGLITIAGKMDSLSNVKITGSKSQRDYEVFQKSAKPISEKMMKLSNEYKAANDALMTEMKNVQKDFVKNNPGSFVTPMLLRTLTRDMKPEETEEIINGLAPEVAKIPVIMDIKARLTAQKSIFIGGKAPDFTLNDEKGKPVSLSSKIGPKLLLIDFWAGWCAPCRQENPNVLKVYNEYRKKGFDIIGVSLDRSRIEWVNAITTDKLPWTQVSDLNYFNSVAAKLYNVESIPANFLINEKGIIIAMNIRGEALNNWVKGMLETGAVTDIDGNVYSTVSIGKQVWMTENLKTTKYRNGDPIPNVVDTAQWKKLSTGAFAYYNNDAKLGKIYGPLYNWYAVNDPRNIAPKGWHVPTEAEWLTLMKYLGGEKPAARKLKETGPIHWGNVNIATNETGFTALPGGYKSVTGICSMIGEVVNFWTATDASTASNSIGRVVDKLGSVEFYISPTQNMTSQLTGKGTGLSLRCIKD